jgi:hypothetical protein
MSKSTAAGIWKTLSKLNVDEHTEDRNGLSYLSWAWAWGIMMEHYPDMTVTWHGDGTHVDHIVYPGGTASVACTVSIGSVRQHMWLPVMDYRHKAIANPDARAISDARMRCMVKCFALFGLGHYIYSGEDLPSPEKPQAAPSQAKNKSAPEKKAAPVERDKNHDFAYGEELIKSIKATANKLNESGWEPEPDFKRRIKAALSRGEVDILLEVKAELEAFLPAAEQLSTPF